MILLDSQRAALRGLKFFAGLLVFVSVIALIGFAIFGLTGCGKKAVTPQATAQVLAATDVWAALPTAIMGDATYAQVNSAWLPGFYDTFRSEIFRQGVTSWDSRFDCNHFATYYAALAQTQFYLSHFQSWTKAESLAVGTFWYRVPNGAHAIVFALTERGLVFIEPQNGQEVTLTLAQRQSAFLVTL